MCQLGQGTVGEQTACLQREGGRIKNKTGLKKDVGSGKEIWFGR